MLITAVLLGSPHVLDYDLLILAPAIAFLISASRISGFRDYNISLLAFVWIAPLFARAVAGACFIPLGFIAIATLFVLAMQHLTHDGAVQPLAREPIAQA